MQGKVTVEMSPLLAGLNISVKGRRVLPRSTIVADTAIGLAATQGMRGLTHRAVDELAGLPIGSSSNIFRTRGALIIGVAERFFDVVNADADLATARQQLAIDYCMRLLGEHRHIFRALIVFSIDPGLPGKAVTVTNNALVRVVATIAELGGIRVEAAKAVLGLMSLQLAYSSENHAEIEEALRVRA